MPGRQRSHNIAAGDRDYRAELDGALKLARKRLSRGRTLRTLFITFPLPVLAAAVWVALAKFTLLDLPWWPVLLAPPVWLLLLAVWLARRPITRSKCARYLDSALDLDERVITCLELDARARFGVPVAAPSAFVETLFADTVEVIQQRLYLLPGQKVKRSRVGRLAPLAATFIALVALAGAIVMPSPVAGVKSQRNAVRAALDEQAQKLADVRAELIKRPDVSDDLKATISSELEKLEAKLRASRLDREQALAEIAATEEKLRGLMPSAVADFEPLVRAAQQVLSAAAGTTEWDPSASKEKGELGLAADASDYLKPYVNLFTNVQGRVMSSALQRAADAAAAKDPGLAQNLSDAAGAVARKDSGQATTALSEAETRFRAEARELEAAQALESALAKLDDGRQTIAKAGGSATKRGQVGFRRSTQAGDKSGAGPDQGQGGADGQQDSNNDPTTANNGANIGQNQPALGVKGGPGPGTTQQGPGAGQAGGGAGGSAAIPSGSGGGQGTGTGTGGSPTGQGGVQGPINGPIRVGGASGGGSNAQGIGTGGASTAQGQPGSGQSERIYVPSKGATQGTGTAGQFAPENTGGDGVGGRVGEGSTTGSTRSAPGIGELTKIRTPYNEVLGQYTDQATEALERAYVPPDAKEYVKQYFTELGKQSK